MAFEGRPGFDAAQLMSQTRQLVRHEYGFLFYLRGRVIRQHSLGAQLAATGFPLVTMWRLTDTPEVDQPSLLMEVHYSHFLMDMPYPKFMATYMLVKEPGATPRDIYDRYAALGENSSFIQGRVFLLAHILGFHSPPPVELVVEEVGADDVGDDDVPVPVGEVHMKGMGDT